MIYQFLYGRKNAGYCQINDANMPFNKNELLKIEGLKTYSIADGLNLNNLPQAYYFYNELMGSQRVGILGKTTFVPAGTSEESGSRHTCFLHAYIITESDYERALKNPAELFENRTFYETVEEYKNSATQPEQQEAKEISADIDPYKLFEEFSIDAEKLKDFIISCIDVFSNSGKRVYCYLPSNDASGSQHAKQLMQLIFSVLHPCIIAGAGFTTYSSTYHNPTSNPIPGNVSVVFIPDNTENRLQAKYEKDRNYIFDFKNYVSPLGQFNKAETTLFDVNELINWMVIRIQGENSEKSVWEIFYNELDKAVVPLVNVDKRFIYSYGDIWLYWLKILNNNKGIMDASEDYQLTWDDCIKIQSNNHEQFHNIKSRKKLAAAAYDILKYQEVLAPYGMNKVSNIIHILLAAADYEEDDLEWIDNIYTFGGKLKNAIIQRLCDQCLFMVESNEETDKVITITNYLYKNVEINDTVINNIYENDKYFPVARIFIKTILNPMVSNNDLSVLDKLKKIFSFVEDTYKEYPNLVLDLIFIDEIQNITEKIIQKPYTDSVADRLKNIICSLNPVLMDAYLFISQKLCYIIISEEVKSGEINNLTKGEVDDLYKWMCDLHLIEYENTMSDKPAFSPLIKLTEQVKWRKIEEHLKCGSIPDINNEFKSSSFTEIRNICRQYSNEIKQLISRYNGDSFDKKDYHEFFCYVYSSEMGSLMKDIAVQILTFDGISSLREFNDIIGANQTADMEEKSNNVIREAVKNYYSYSGSRKRLTESDKKFIRMIGLTNLISGLSSYDDLNDVMPGSYMHKEAEIGDMELDVLEMTGSKKRENNDKTVKTKGSIKREEKETIEDSDNKKKSKLKFWQNKN